MADISKISPDDGSTILNIKDNNAVRWGDQSKGYVGKNKLQNKGASKSGNISFTVNSDGSVSLSGSNSSAQILDINTLTGAEIKALGGQLVLSGGNVKAYIAIRTSTWTFVARSYGTDVSFNTSDLADNTTYYVTIGVQASVNVDGVVLYPMIRLASISNSTYEPYLTPNTDLVSKNNSYTSTLSDVFSDYSNINTANVVRNDILCNIRLTSKQVAASGSWTTIGTLKENYRPKIMIYETAIDAAGVPFGWIRIHDDTGVIEVYHSSGSTKVVNFSSIYFTNSVL